MPRRVAAPALVLLALGLSGCLGPAPPADGEAALFEAREEFEPPGRVAQAEVEAWRDGGVAWWDAEGDGAPDAWLTGPEGVRRVLRNLTAAASPALTTCACRARAVAPADMDHDGDADLAVAVAGERARLYRNDGTALAEVAAPLPVDAVAVGWVDLDNDGLLDLLWLRQGEPLALRNLHGAFEEANATVWPRPSGEARAGAFVDLDADGLLDVVLAGPERVQAFRNLNGSFEGFPAFAANATATALAAGDMDNSATQDVLLAGPAGVAVLPNARGRGFREPVPVSAAPAWSAAFLDPDLDGDLDVVAAPRAGGLALFRNAAGAFEAVGPEESGLPAAGAFRGLAVGDADGDGRADLLAGRLDGPAVLFRARSAEGHFLKVVPQGVASNRDGVGVRGVAIGPALLLERYATGGMGLSTSAPQLLFGLGGTNLTNLRLQWPSGTFQDLPIAVGEGRDRVLFASEEARLTTWGDAC